jgi:hypothetical protein
MRNSTTFIQDNTTLNDIDVEDDPDIGQLMIMIMFGSVIVCACCIGIYLCYKENKQSQEWRKWVMRKKRGDP